MIYIIGRYERIRHYVRDNNLGPREYHAINRGELLRGYRITKEDKVVNLGGLNQKDAKEIYWSLQLARIAGGSR